MYIIYTQEKMLDLQSADGNHSWKDECLYPRISKGDGKFPVDNNILRTGKIMYTTEATHKRLIVVYLDTGSVH